MEAELSRPSTRRALTAGAIALAVIAPTVDSAERTAEAVSLPPSSTPAADPAPGIDPTVVFSPRVPRISRSAVRGLAAARPAGVRPAAVALKRAARHAADRERSKIAAVRRTEKSRRIQQAAVVDRAVAARRAETRFQRRTQPSGERRTEDARPRKSPKRSVRHRKQRASAAVPARMARVVTFARAQLGKRYARGGEGPHSFDCSGFTKRAYAQIGLQLPHSSSGQAALARRISRSQARPGDLVVGPGHVGVYMGRGMMIDAGNRRTGVVYRKLYAGLRIERF